MFWKYLNKNFQKEFIQKSKLSTKYLILFTLKKNELLQFYINYWKFNNIIIKN